MFVKTLFENSLAPFERITGLLTFLGVSFWYLWRSWPVWNAVWRWPWQDYQQHPRGPFGRWSNGGKFDSLLFDAMFFNVATTWNNRKRWNTMWLNVMDMVTGKKMPETFHQPQQIHDLHAKLIKLGNPKTFFLNSLISLMCFLFPPPGRFRSGGGHYPCKHWQRDGCEGWRPLWKLEDTCWNGMPWKPIWVFAKIGVPQNGWFIMENPIKNGWFAGTPFFGNTHIRPLGNS